jgi:serine/threonine protein kinase
LCETYDFKADIWSLGVTLFELLTSDGFSNYPFIGSNKSEILHNIKTGQYQVDSSKFNLSPYCIDFLNHCLQYSPERRATATQLLNHPFLSVEYRLQRKHFLENFSAGELSEIYGSTGAMNARSRAKKLFLVELDDFCIENDDLLVGSGHTESLTTRLELGLIRNHRTATTSSAGDAQT